IASVGSSTVRGVASVAQIMELHAFHDAAVVYIETGDDALGQHWLNLTEIFQDEKPHGPRFFWMELHSENIFLFDDGGKLRSVFACRRSCGNYRRLKRMGVVDKGVGSDVTQQARAFSGRSFPYRQRVPSDVRRFHR